MNGYEFRTELAKICPDYSIDKDNSGQIVIYTNLKEFGNDEYVPCTEESISWSELAELTHKTQVMRFGFCSCEDNEGNENPYSDCPEPRVRVLREVEL